MIRTLTVLCLFTVTISSAQTGDKVSLADDLKKLQGVWQSPADAKHQMNVMFLGDKLGFEVIDLKAKPGQNTLGFLALSAGQHKEVKGKRLFEVEVTKDYIRGLGYRFDKAGLVIIADEVEYMVERASTRASTSADAKKLVGTWRVLEIENQGKKVKAESVGLDAVVITEDRYILQGPGGKELLNSFYRIDASKKPAVIDWYGMKPSFVIPLIYEIKENEIRLAHPPFDLIGKGAQRPASFDTKGNNVSVLHAERKK